MSKYHIPVLKNETIEILNIKSGEWYVDCNLGGGGHTEAILKAGGNVLAIDLDPDAIHNAEKNYSEYIDSHRLIIVQDNFNQIQNITTFHEISPMGILYDLGVSTHQLDTPMRGFSFNTGGPLDMRMNPHSGIPASDLVNGLHEKELSELFWKLGEERMSRPIAKAIVNSRSQNPILTSDHLAQVILNLRHRTGKDRTHPATRVFQALRIAVNDELNALKESLPEAFKVLATNGRIVVISFHSLEDRIVKNFFNQKVTEAEAIHLIKKPLTPTEQEISDNPRSRSGKLRAIEKIITD